MYNLAVPYGLLSKIINAPLIFMSLMMDDATMKVKTRLHSFP